MALIRSAEAMGVRLALALARRLGPVRASDLGGLVARTLGPMLPVTRVARDNLARALPNLSPDERARIVRGVWDNLGRTAAELVHMPDLVPTSSGPGLEVVGARHVPRSGPALLVSAHLANWEAMPRAAAIWGVRMATFYRAAANARVDALILAERARATGGAPAFAKGAGGARAGMAWLKQGQVLGMLVDQKMNDGIRARLFGHPAMTAPAAAALAMRFGCPLVPVRTVRLGPARLRVICEAPIPHPATGDRQADLAHLTQAVNDRIEAWVREEPAQWLWLHRRWPKH